MLEITYLCQTCGKEAPEGHTAMICPYCGGDLKGDGFPMVTGTRDGFGIGRKFYHNDGQKTKEITTWPEWERAGYKDAISDTRNKNVARMAKEKMKRIKQKGGKSML